MTPTTQTYKTFIKELKTKIQTAQIRASIKVNEELLKLYWNRENILQVVVDSFQIPWGHNREIANNLGKSYER